MLVHLLCKVQAPRPAHREDPKAGDEPVVGPEAAPSWRAGRQVPRADARQAEPVRKPVGYGHVVKAICDVST